MVLRLSLTVSKDYIMLTATYIVPAYGRTYKTKDVMLADWNAGKDFKIARGGPYCSIRDLDKMRTMLDSLYLYDPATGIQFKVA